MDTANRERLSLFTPGPVPLSDAAHEALTQPVLHHRSEEFRSVMSALMSHLKGAFDTEDRVAVLTSSGTGALDAVVAGLFGSDDRVLVPVAGKFSRRWAEICRAYGVEVSSVELRPGRSPSAHQIAEKLQADERITGLLLTHCETSTGSLTDVRAICEAVRGVERGSGRSVIVCVDCISSLLVDEFHKDSWSVDCAIAASQKGMLAPPGLAFVSMNRRTLARLKPANRSVYYFDLRRYFEGGQECPFTPAVTLVAAARASLAAMLEIGYSRVIKANASAAAGIRMIVEAAGFEVLADRPSNALAAFWTEGVDPDALTRGLRLDHGILLAQGQQELKGRILRISTIGRSGREILGFAEAFQSALDKLGRPFDLEGKRQELERVLEESSLWESLRS